MKKNYLTLLFFLPVINLIVGCKKSALNSTRFANNKQIVTHQTDFSTILPSPYPVQNEDVVLTPALDISESGKTPQESRGIFSTAITRKDLVYQHFGKRYPQFLSIMINNKEIFRMEKKDILIQGSFAIPIHNNHIVLEYSYEWYVPWGNKKGTKQVNYQIQSTNNAHVVTFNSWKEPYRFTISDATPVTEEIKIAE